MNSAPWSIMARIEESLVLFVHQVFVIALAMCRVKGVIAQHVKRFIRKIIFRDVINVFIVSPREMHVVEAGAFFVNTRAGLETRVP